MDQIAIALTGSLAAWLSQDHRYNCRRYACLFGLIGQPFWFYATWKAQQWGIFTLSIIYTWAWYRGFRLYWLRKGVEE